MNWSGITTSSPSCSDPSKIKPAEYWALNKEQQADMIWETLFVRTLRSRRLLEAWFAS